jgi:hypothetical protein
MTKQMKQILVFVLILTILFIPTSFSQGIHEIFKIDSLNFYQIESYLESNPEILKQASEKEFKFFKRWEWFWSTRIDKSGSFDKTREVINESTNSTLLNLSGSIIRNLPTLNWESEGPDSRPTGQVSTIRRGRFMCIYVDPDDSTHMFVGAHNGGLWETNDEGVTWECLTDDYFINGVV